MTTDTERAVQLQSLVAAPELAEAFKGEYFNRFLDLIPIPIMVSCVQGSEIIVYANPECAIVFGRDGADLIDRPWTVLTAESVEDGSLRPLADAIVESPNFVGYYAIARPGAEPVAVGVYSNVIVDDEDGNASYRLVAFLAEVGLEAAEREALEQRIRDKDTLLFEIQHRVKNNLQMIAALIRIEARNAGNRIDTAPFDRLAGRIQAIQTLYGLLAVEGHQSVVDLGVYLSQIAATVLGLHSVEGVTLDLKVESFPVSVNVAMPTGLVINELLTNALKHAFAGGNGGTITLHSRADDDGCHIIVADDGAGLPEGVVWPTRGKLSAAIAQSLRDNANATIHVQSAPGDGTRITISFPRSVTAA